MRSRSIRLRLAGLWRQPDFLKFWSAESVSLFGTQTTLLAIPLTAALLLDATPRQMGVLGALGGASAFLSGFFSGVLVDQVRRIPIMVAADVLNALLIISVPLIWLFGDLGMAQLYAIEFLVGGLSTLSYISAQSYLPSVVANEFLVDANGKLRASEALSQVAGPPLAGSLAQIVAAPLILIVDSLSYLTSALLLWSMRTNEVRLSTRKKASTLIESLKRTFKGSFEGLRWLLADPVLRGLLASSSSFNVFAGFFAALFVIFATRELGFSPVAVGLVLAAQGAGSVLGAILVKRIVGYLGLGPALVLAAAGQSLGWLALPFAGAFGIPAFPVIAAGLAVSGFSFVVYVVGAVSLRQTLTPDEILGRVNAVSVSLILGAIPVGSLAGGFLAAKRGNKERSHTRGGLRSLRLPMDFLFSRTAHKKHERIPRRA